MGRRNHRPKSRRREHSDPITIEMIQRIQDIEAELRLRRKRYQGVVVIMTDRQIAYPKSATTWEGTGIVGETA